MSKIYRKTGFSIIQVLVVAGLLGGLSLVLAQVMNGVSSMMRRQHEAAALTSVQSSVDSLGRKLPQWIAYLRANGTTSAWAAKCLPMNPALDYDWSTCPVGGSGLVAATDPKLPVTALLPKHYTVALVSLNGDKLAGTVTSPLRVDANGGPCAGAECRFDIVGFMASQRAPNAAPGPGSVQFIVRIQRTTQANQVSQPFSTRYLSLNVGESWTLDSNSSITLGDCPENQVLTGYDANKDPICKKVEIVSVSGSRARPGPAAYIDSTNGMGMGGEWLGASYRAESARPTKRLTTSTACTPAPPSPSNAWLGAHWTSMCNHYKKMKDSSKTAAVRANQKTMYQTERAIIRGPKYGEWQMETGANKANPSTWLDADDVDEGDAGRYNQLPAARKTFWEVKMIAKAPPRGCTYDRGAGADRCSGARAMFASEHSKTYLLGNYIKPYNAANPDAWDNREIDRLVDYNDGTLNQFGQLCPRGYRVASCMRSSLGVTNSENAESDAGIITTNVNGKRFSIGCRTNDFFQVPSAGVKLVTNCLKIDVSDVK